MKFARGGESARALTGFEDENALAAPGEIGCAHKSVVTRTYDDCVVLAQVPVTCSID